MSSTEVIDNQIEETAAPFRASYPLEFNLHNDDQQSVLYIDEIPGGYPLCLEITNTSGRDITLDDLGNSPPTAQNHHFELVFRPNTISSAAWKKISLQKNGAWVLGKGSSTGQTQSLYLLCQQPLIIEAGKSLRLTLDHVNVAAGGGSRGTRVEFRYQNLKCQGESVSGSRVQHLDIINHHGKKHIPLHVGFVGSNTILNDGVSPNTLELRITNVLKPDPAQPERSNIHLSSDSKNRSKFIVSFDVKAAEAWALGTKNQIEGIKIESEGGKVKLNKEGESPVWALIPNKPTLDPGKSINIQLSNIITSKPSGHTNLYIRYENVPGYWDGQFICTIEKTPIVCRQDMVGIGTTPNTAAKAKLEVQGGDKKIRFYSESGSSGQVQIVNPENSKERSKGQKGRQISLGFYTNEEIDKEGSGWIVGRNVGNIGENCFGIGNNKEAKIVVNSDGNVGIGKKDPSEKLDVEGSVKANQFLGEGSLLQIKDLDQYQSSQSLKDLITDILYNMVPVGTIVAYYGEVNNLPKGWLYCDGTSFKKNDYPDLEPVIQKNSVPDLRGYFLRGLDITVGVDPDGESRKIGSFQEDCFKNHNHSMATVLGVPIKKGTGVAWFGDRTVASTLAPTQDGRGETRPKNIAVNYIIFAGIPKH